MNEQKFEEKLKLMTKPEIDQLKHQELLAKAITSAKDKSILSWWWLAVPLYLIAVLLMKSFFLSDTSLISNMHDLTAEQNLLSVIFFLLLPVIIIVINSISIRKVYFLTGRPALINFITIVWLNVLMIFFSILVLIIYSL
jgi:hypothetical protein